MTEMYLEQFESDAKRPCPDWVRSLRQSAWNRFAELGFPNTSWEEWRHTPVSSLTRQSFQSAKAYSPNGLKLSQLGELALSSLPGLRLVLVNGRFSPDLSSLDGAPGVIAMSLAEALLKDPAKLEAHLGRVAPFQDHPFVALNTAFLNDGIFLFLPKGTVLKDPVHFLFVSDPHGASTVSHPRILVVAGENVQASLVESYVGTGSEPYFTNGVTEIVAGENSVIEHHKIQSEKEGAFHFGTLSVRQAGRSRFTSHNVSLGGGLVRNDLNAILAEEGAECLLYGLYLGRGNQLVDNHTNIDHAQPHCTSGELYKGILDGKSQAVFNGRIVVRPHAEKTNARQTNKNLLLSNDAAVNTKPLLEIFNNDVKCNHGATIGRLDENQIFYLRSRGIDDEMARSLLTYAFASDVVSAMKIETLKTTLQSILFAQLLKGKMPLEGLEGFKNTGGRE